MTNYVRAVVRTAELEDLQSVLDVHAQQGTRKEVQASGLERQTWERMMATEVLTVYVAEVGSDVVGTATAIVMPNVTYECAPTLFIEAVVVAPGYRRRGIATAMIRTVLADAQAAGCNKIQLLSHKRHASDGAHRLYTSVGFEPEAEGFRLYLDAREARTQTEVE